MRYPRGMTDTTRPALVLAFLASVSALAALPRAAAQLVGPAVTAEHAALASKDFQYLTKHYLPKKLKEKDWLD